MFLIYSSLLCSTGTIDRLSPRELEQLYAGELSLNVATRTVSSLVRGRLAARPMADARDSPSPHLLTRINMSTPASLVGMAWIAADVECSLHYEVSDINQKFNIDTLSILILYYNVLVTYLFTMQKRN